MASELRKDPVPEGDVHKESTDPQAAEDSQASDNEGGERPVRNKLKETSITSVPTSFTEQAQPQDGGNPSRDSSRGRKRSFDDDEPEKSDDDGEMDDAGHRRKRSRDSSYEEANATVSKTEEGQQPAPSKNADDLSRKILSPKKKRSRDQLDKDETKTDDGAMESEKTTAAAENGALSEKTSAEGEPEKKRHRDTSQEREKAPATSAFANTSTVSPFGSLGASPAKKEEESKPAATTSSSAFASSSLAAFSGSEKSPFGSLGSSTPSVFKSPEGTEAAKPAATGFAAAAGSSGFSALGSGFSGFSGGFGASQPKAGLTSFASPSVPSVLSSSSKDKPFGAPADEEEEEEKNKEENVDSGPGEFEQDKTDERFFERPIETGEEEEKTYFSCKAKLFQFSDKEWRERGIGTFKINVKVTDGKEDKASTRLIMRADGVGRVMLNTPIFKGMTVGDASGNEPNSKQIHLASLESGRSVPILLRTGHEDHARELYQVVCDLLKEQ
ncbi:hypothetical protein P170DRAFT_202818 [Aspergillus steynii IBT 23096]|uniref:RanBD1 domain-containing protein n=1 Tax=Aspergillus steynii IBT 23096 TaxID=1392250 RepID=A0A2I2G558_9EURO|nr:uncharacterized protein P170DRAFT_202818 [Aspergillus steynii IBT 23096]PLB48010.1 hypothetical protein P170DRAFT_202818 [Aspergillus steynii IBT 23096]